ESTAFGGVSRPTYVGGLGFEFKWNMGWMHDTLVYFSKEPVFRKYHQGTLTFSMIYAYTENFILVLSHDEVVHGKSSMLSKMPGDVWQKFANLRLLYTYMMAHPGKKLLFMGQEFGQWNEWREDKSIDWHLTEFEPHRKLQNMVSHLNSLYRSEPALYEIDFEQAGFEWIDFYDSDNSVISFIRKAKNGSFVVVALNFTPVVRCNYKIGTISKGFYREIFNSDSSKFGGSDNGNGIGVNSLDQPWNGKPFCLDLTIPPLGGILLKLNPEETEDNS
ncbi:MAG: alpha amylase C-terminal domain-containing protein, partial [Brevinematales bacterium]